MSVVLVVYCIFGALFLFTMSLGAELHSEFLRRSLPGKPGPTAMKARGWFHRSQGKRS